jgi:hypothetical protein
MNWFAKTELFQASLEEILKQGESGKVEVTTTTGEKFLLHEPITIGSDFIAFQTSSGAAGRSVTLPISSISHILHDQPLER